MSIKLTFKLLGSFLWESEDIFKGKMYITEFKEYISSVIFLKGLPDAFDNENDIKIIADDFIELAKVYFK
tara:strand:- start:578 stop:787 length:210 start_codon:yes stop_codon:yes gene_type:complete